jgi:hypothetical protein
MIIAMPVRKQESARFPVVFDAFREHAPAQAGITNAPVRRTVVPILLRRRILPPGSIRVPAGGFPRIPHGAAIDLLPAGKARRPGGLSRPSVVQGGGRCALYVDNDLAEYVADGGTKNR